MNYSLLPLRLGHSCGDFDDGVYGFFLWPFCIIKSEASMLSSPVFKSKSFSNPVSLEHGM